MLALAMSMSGVMADPAADALSKLSDLSRQAVQAREAVTTAQRDADDRLAAHTAAEERHRADVLALEAANSQLEPFQTAVDRIAAMTYMGGGNDQFSAALTAASPQQLIDKLSVQRVVVAETADQMKAFQLASARAAAAATESEKSAADARLAAERLDVTLPPPPEQPGLTHAISRTMDEMAAIFGAMGFGVGEGLDVQTDWYNFSALNIPGAPYPCIFPDHRVTFRVAAPDAQKVRLRIGPGFDMTKAADGLWYVTTTPQVVGFTITR